MKSHIEYIPSGVLSIILLFATYHQRNTCISVLMVCKKWEKWIHDHIQEIFEFSITPYPFTIAQILNNGVSLWKRNFVILVGNLTPVVKLIPPDEIIFIFEKSQATIYKRMKLENTFWKDECLMQLCIPYALDDDIAMLQKDETLMNANTLIKISTPAPHIDIKYTLDPCVYDAIITGSGCNLLSSFLTQQYEQYGSYVSYVLIVTNYDIIISTILSIIVNTVRVPMSEIYDEFSPRKVVLKLDYFVLFSIFSMWKFTKLGLIFGKAELILQEKTDSGFFNCIIPIGIQY